MKTDFSKAEAIKIVTLAAKEYKEKLEGKNLLFVYLNGNHIESFETLFQGNNFQHLTGLEMLDSRGTKIKNPKFFYSKCIKGKLKESEIAFRKDGTTVLKLNAILSAVIYIDQAKMTGLFTETGLKLVVDRLVGTTSYCIGLKKKGQYYLPSSCLLEDIRKMAKPWSRIIAVFSKSAVCKEEKYSTLRYVAKDYSFDESILPAEISVIENNINRYN